MRETACATHRTAYPQQESQAGAEAGPFWQVLDDSLERCFVFVLLGALLGLSEKKESLMARCSHCHAMWQCDVCARLLRIKLLHARRHPARHIANSPKFAACMHRYCNDSSHATWCQYCQYMCRQATAPESCTMKASITSAVRCAGNTTEKTAALLAVFPS